MAMKPMLNELPRGSNEVQIPVGKRTKGRVITSAFWSCESHKSLSLASIFISPILSAPLDDSQMGELVRSIHRIVKESS